MLKPSKTKTHGIKGNPTTPRPPKPPSQNIKKQESTELIVDLAANHDKKKCVNCGGIFIPSYLAIEKDKCHACLMSDI